MNQEHGEFWNRCEQAVERASEWLNPILVKEARQAMKSRQFAITFGLLLLCGWGWTMLGTAVMSPAIYYSSAGNAMLIGYYVILAFPLIVIVPFTAYRSLAAEREDGTYELLSITTLKSRQIIAGKLGSAVLQMLVYFSALSPCMAFTYLLRGIDIVTIGLTLGYTFLASVGLSALSLLLATVSRTRHWQIVWMVQLIVGLFALFCVAAQGVGFFVIEAEAIPYDRPVFWIAQGTILSAYGTYLTLALLAATARISFASENRSTRLRWVMLVQQVIYIGWFAWFWLVVQEEEIFYAYYIMAGLHWAVMAALLVGESPEVSQRVRRSLPQSFLGRVFLTWMNPGPSAGYMFAVANLFALTAIGFVGTLFAKFPIYSDDPLATLEAAINVVCAGGGLFDSETITGLLIFCYIVIYAGLTRLLMGPVNRRFSRPGPMGSLVICSILALFGCLIPMIVQFSLYRYMSTEYSIVQAPNFVWTLSEAIDDSGFLLTQIPTVALVATFALLVFAINVFGAATEVLRVRQAAPVRIAIDEAQLHPERYVVTKPKSPFDEEPEPAAVKG